MREHKRTPKKRKSGGGTRNKRYRGGATPVVPPSEESVALAEEPPVVREPVGNRLPIFENIAPSDTPSVQGSYIPKMQHDTIDIYIEKEPTVSVSLGTKSYIKFIKCINSNALDKLSKIMYSTLLNKGDEEVHLLIQDSLCLYNQHKLEIEKMVIGNLRKLEEDVKDLKDNIDKYSREYDVKKFRDDIMSSDDQYFANDKGDFKGMFVNIMNEFNSGIFGFRGNEVSSKVFENEEKVMERRSPFELNKFYLFNIIDFMIFMGIKVREELEEYLEAINQLVQFNNDIIKLQKNIKKGEEEANKKEEVMMDLRELFKDEKDYKQKKQKDFILKKVVDQMNGSSVLVDLKTLIDEKRLKRGNTEEIIRIDEQINVKKSELMKEISTFKLEDNDNVTIQIEKGIEGMDVSNVENPKDKEEAKKVRSLLQELVNEKKKLEQISKKQRGGAASAVSLSPDEEIQQINEKIKRINSELEAMKKKREEYMLQIDNTWTWRNDPLFMYYYYNSMGNSLGNLLNYQIEFWSSLQSSIDDSLNDLSNVDIDFDFDIESFFENIVVDVENSIEGAGDGLIEAAIASQELITGFLSGGYEVLGVVFSAGSDIIGGLGSVVGGIGEGLVEVGGELVSALEGG